MSEIRAQIDAALKQARRDRDEATRNVIGMVKNKALMELKSGKGVEDNDDLWLKVLASYAKQLKKSMEQFKDAGERGVEALAEAEFELAFCERFLPSKLDEAATRTLVQGIIDAQGITDAKMMGKLMGVVMKSHRDEVDAGLVQKVAREILAG